ncbi:MAG: UDP-N-acetylmuramoyl-L-alanyl-D-glutamate--2,6-diaminopimelate ligase [Patescibacteria group bacterium]|nr:UDP-N-acetylmuramoyl-L-alanyl-D-glutamate--2,6-diaminopimelate ligase [Patescibacteria group bacterium]
MQYLKKIIPEKILKFLRPFYHGALALAGHFYFGRPSRRLIVIGVTGTNGKSTTVNLIAQILQEAGYKTGYTSTVTMNVNGKEYLNKIKMTMPSGWVLQKHMRQMLKSGCQYAVLEVSSEGLAQNRHLGINFDAAVFTNLTPEHLESHGGFENYKLAKSKLFASLIMNKMSAEKRRINRKLGKAIVFNADDQYGKYYASFKSDLCLSYGVKNRQADLIASDIKYSPDGLEFIIHNSKFIIHLKGQFDVYNSLAAIAAAQSQNISLEICRSALEKIPVVPGRMEIIQGSPFTVLVDYAYEPEEMRQLYETVSRWPHGRIIQVLGPTGGGRDKARIFTLGEMAGKFASEAIITTDDPYDEDPKALSRPMVEGAAAGGKTEGQNLFCEYDRRLAIRLALRRAQAGDLVLITGKGADQKMALAAGTYADWDDRGVAREELKELQVHQVIKFIK